MEIYGGSHAPDRDAWTPVARRLRELCHAHGLADRMPRPILPGPLATTKRIAEKLFLRTYDLELEGASTSRVWAYRRAAWTVDALEQPIEELAATGGEPGLRALPGIGPSLAGLIQRWLAEMRDAARPRDQRGSAEPIASRTVLMSASRASGP